MKNKQNFMCLIRLIFSIFFITLSAQAAFANGGSDLYQAKDGKVDAATFTGWNAYNYVCVTCHGVGAEGTEIAPDLSETTKRLSLEQFRLKVLHTTIVRFTSDDWRTMEQAMFEEIAKQQSRDSGELATMPRWEYNPAVKANVENIYRYLKARADGVIGPEKPGLLK